MDEPTAQKQPYGRCVQYGERELHAGDETDEERVLGQSADTLLLQEKMEQWLDQCGQSVPRLNGAWNTRFGQVLRHREQLHQAAD